MTNNLTASVSRYGYPIATFNETTLFISRRNVVAESVIWDAEYSAYRVIGWYAKKDGTRGAQIAKPIAFACELPSDIVEALRLLISEVGA
jgi:hypothetical protein